MANPLNSAHKVRTILAPDEKEFWTAKAALLDPDAYVLTVSSSFAFTVTAGECWYLLNAWNGRLGTNGGTFYHRDPLHPMMMTGGFNLQGNGTANAFAYYCRPSLVSGTQKYADPKGLYFERLARIKNFTQRHLYAVTPTGAYGGTSALFPTDFTRGLVVAAMAHDVSWTVLRCAGGTTGGINLADEISDTHQIRFARGFSEFPLPFTVANFDGIQAANASVSGATGGTSDIAGTGSIMYVPLPSDW